jgi:hypothetical protein
LLASERWIFLYVHCDGVVDFTYFMRVFVCGLWFSGIAALIYLWLLLSDLGPLCMDLAVVVGEFKILDLRRYHV